MRDYGGIYSMLSPTLGVGCSVASVGVNGGLLQAQQTMFNRLIRRTLMGDNVCSPLIRPGGGKAGDISRIMARRDWGKKRRSRTKFAILSDLERQEKYFRQI